VPQCLGLQNRERERKKEKEKETPFQWEGSKIMLMALRTASKEWPISLSRQHERDS
jgi:hypothetical protein